MIRTVRSLAIDLWVRVAAELFPWILENYVKFLEKSNMLSYRQTYDVDERTGAGGAQI